MQNLHQASDEQLVALYENGNDAAFDVLLERYQKVVFGFILHAVCDVPTAEDIFQDTFFKAIAQIRSHRYVEKGRFQSWLIRIANNLIVDSFRHRPPLKEIADERERARLFERQEFSVGTIEDDYHNQQTLHDIGWMIAQLPQPQQEIVRMRIYEKMSFKEIAAQLGCSINTALGRMRYAVINLRRIVARSHADLTFVGIDR